MWKYKQYYDIRRKLRYMPNIIIVDDDKDTILTFADYLAIHKIEVLGLAYDGKEAIELYKKLKPDIVLLDIMMPEYDGFYAFEGIRKLNPDAKIIAVTADLTADTEKKLIQLNANALTYKPYDVENIIETIEKVNKDGSVLTSPPSKLKNLV